MPCGLNVFRLPCERCIDGIALLADTAVGHCRVYRAVDFFRAMDDGQFDDLDGPGMRILQDDDRPSEKADQRD